MTTFIIVGTVIRLLYLLATRTGQSPGTGFIIVDVVMSLLFFLIGLYLLYASMRGGLNAYNLRRHSVVVEGSIIAHRSRNVREGYRGGPVNEQYVVTYSYDYGGKTYTHEQVVDGAPWEGKAVSVRCVAHHPKVALLEGRASASLIKARKVALIVLPSLAVIFLGLAIFAAIQLL